MIKLGYLSGIQKGWEYRFEYLKHSQTATEFQLEIKVYKTNSSDFAPQKGFYVNEAITS